VGKHTTDTREILYVDTFRLTFCSGKMKCLYCLAQVWKMTCRLFVGEEARQVFTFRVQRLSSGVCRYGRQVQGRPNGYFLLQCNYKSVGLNYVACFCVKENKKGGQGRLLTSYWKRHARHFESSKKSQTALRLMAMLQTFPAEVLVVRWVCKQLRV
jgi:hypothetical protein